jgi:hypothetical protein
LKNFNKKPKLLIIGGSHDSVILVKFLAKSFYIILIDIDINCPAHDFSDKFINISTFDYQSQLSLISQYNICYCVTRSTGIAARNCYQLNEFILNGKHTDFAEKILNKAMLPSFCNKNNILHPNTITSDVDHLSYSFFTPCIVKPVYEKVGKIATFKVDTKNLIQDFLNKSNENSYVNKSVIQEYLEGEDYSLVGLAHNGKYKSFGVFQEKNMMNDGFLIHDGFHIANDIDQQPFIKIANFLASCIKIPLCPFNIGFRISGGKIYLLECNLDFGGEGVLEKLRAEHETDPLSYFVEELMNKNFKGYQDES